MINLSTFIIVFYYLCLPCDSGTLPASQQIEQTLITSLLSGYNKNIRPDDQVSVDITATIQQIVSIDEKQQIMTSSSFISQTWFDERLAWDPTNNSNIEVIMLPVKSLWIPDTMILNSADTNGYLTISDYSMASVYNTGQVYMIIPVLTARTRCNLYVLKFPFDKQICSINLTSWSQGSNRILYTENSSLVADLSEYSQHVLWKLDSVDVIVSQGSDRVPFEDTYANIISIQLYLKRKPLFFIMNGIFACLILNCVTLISFTLPFASQVALCMVCFMTYSVYSLNFSSLFPQQSEYLMMITLYFLLSIGWTLVSMAWFVIFNQFMSKSEMPKSLYIFCGWLQRMFFCCFPRPKKEDKTDLKMNVMVENGQLTTDSQAMNLVPPLNLSAACLRKSNKVDTIDEKENTNDKEVESIKPMEAAISASVNKTNENAKTKCNFCNRCKSCQSNVDKDKVKAKNKKDIEGRCNALNYFVLFWVTIFMFISNMVLWLLMAN